MGKHTVCFDLLYSTHWQQPGDVYDFMASALLKEAELHSHAIYALPGSPVFLEDTTRILRQRAPADVQINIIHGLSFVEEALAQLNLDFADGLQLVLLRTHLESGRFTPKLALLVCQIEARSLSSDAPTSDFTSTMNHPEQIWQTS